MQYLLHNLFDKFIIGEKKEGFPLKRSIAYNSFVNRFLRGLQVI